MTSQRTAEDKTCISICFRGDSLPKGSAAWSVASEGRHAITGQRWKYYVRFLHLPVHNCIHYFWFCCWSEPDLWKVIISMAQIYIVKDVQIKILPECHCSSYDWRNWDHQPAAESLVANTYEAVGHCHRPKTISVDNSKLYCTLKLQRLERVGEVGEADWLELAFCITSFPSQPTAAILDLQSTHWHLTDAPLPRLSHELLQLARTNRSKL